MVRGGELLPQKSTHFYPKLLDGLVFHRLARSGDVDAPLTPRYAACRVKRLEDPRLLTGPRPLSSTTSRLPGMLSSSFVRSPHAHARNRPHRRRCRPRAAGRRRGRHRRGSARRGPAARASARGRRIHAHGVARRWPTGRARFCRRGGGRGRRRAPRPRRRRARGGHRATANRWPRRDADRRRRWLPARSCSSGDGGAATSTAAFARAASSSARRSATAGARPSPLEPRGMVADWDGEALTVVGATPVPVAPAHGAGRRRSGSASRACGS